MVCYTLILPGFPGILENNPGSPIQVIKCCRSFFVNHIVDGRNPAPVHRQFIPLFTSCLF